MIAIFLSWTLSKKGEKAMSRTKDQWLEETDGFRVGESPDQFKQRIAAIAQLRKAIEDGEARPSDVELLSKLLGTEDADE